MLRICCVLLLGVVALIAADRPAVINLSAIPDAEPTHLLSIHEPLARYLGQRVGVPVRFQPVTRYELAVEGMAGGQLDLVWFGGYTSVQAVRATPDGAERIAMRAEDAEFKSVFIARAGAGITGFADLRGKTLAFGSVSSTSGHLMPRHFLAAAGINPDTDCAKVLFSGAHDATAKLVAAGSVDAGALNHLTWQRLVDGGTITADQATVFATTPPYVDYCWVVRKALPADLRSALRQALLDLDPADPEQAALLTAHGASRYIAAEDGQWAGIEAAARSAGMLK